MLCLLTDVLNCVLKFNVDIRSNLVHCKTRTRRVEVGKVYYSWTLDRFSSFDSVQCRI